MTYTLFAGINGSGKTTLFKSAVFGDIGVRINIDDIAREIYEEYTLFPMKAGKIALAKIEDCIKNGLAFNQETTLSGHTALKTIERVKDAQYKVVMYYVYIDSPERAIARVANRVSKGGHNVSDDVIRRRYGRSLINLKKVIKLCNEVYIFDNSNDLPSEKGSRLICFLSEGIAIHQDENIPQALLDCLHP